MVIEVGLGGAKQPEVKNVEEAAARTVAVAKDESRFEDVDISAWLDEADLIDRQKKLGDPETRQLRLDETVQAKLDETDSGELSVNEDGKTENGKKAHDRIKRKSANCLSISSRASRPTIVAKQLAMP